MSLRKVVLAGSALFFLTVRPAAFAEQIDLGKIIVTASRIDETLDKTSRKVDVVTSSEIGSSGADNIAGVLSPLSSVNISDYGGASGIKNIRMRGSSSSQVLVMVDGRPVNNPRDGAVDLDSISLDNVERVEVLHGPASSLYGSQAMGGVVNIITKRPPKEGQAFDLTSSGGSFRTLSERLSYGNRLGALGCRISGAYQTSGGFRDNTEYDAKDLNGRFEYNLNDESTLNFNTGYFRNRAGSPGTITSPDADDKQKNVKNFFDLGWTYKSVDAAGFELRAYRNEDRLEFIENTAGSVFDTPFSRATHDTKVYGFNAQCNKLFFDFWQIIAGLNHSKNLNDSTSTAKHGYDFNAGYLESQWELLDRIKVSAGGRLDDYSNFGSQLDPSASFLFQWNDRIKSRGSVSRSFRAPTFNDLYWPDEGWAKGNPDLRPEKGMTYEIGTDWRLSDTFSAGVTYYRNNFDQLISWAESGGVWQPMNVDSAVMDGVEVDNTIRLAQDLELRLNYTFLKAIDARTKLYLTDRPRNKVDAVLKGKALYGISYECKGQFTDRRFADAENNDPVKRFFVIGLNLSKELKPGISLFVTLDNLTGRNYQVIGGYPMPGFAANTGIKAEF